MMTSSREGYRIHGGEDEIRNYTQNVAGGDDASGVGFE
jgi:hypothetical protein